MGPFAAQESSQRCCPACGRASKRFLRTRDAKTESSSDEMSVYEAPERSLGASAARRRVRAEEALAGALRQSLWHGWGGEGSVHDGDAWESRSMRATQHRAREASPLLIIMGEARDTSAATDAGQPQRASLPPMLERDAPAPSPSSAGRHRRDTQTWEIWRAQETRASILRRDPPRQPSTRELEVSGKIDYYQLRLWGHDAPATTTRATAGDDARQATSKAGTRCNRSTRPCLLLLFSRAKRAGSR